MKTNIILQTTLLLYCATTAVADIDWWPMTKPMP